MDIACNDCLKVVRPQIVPYVECMDEAMRYIPTTIGNEYGDIYEMQFETARASSLNNAIVPSFFETHMKPVMQMR